MLFDLDNVSSYDTNLYCVVYKTSDGSFRDMLYCAFMRVFSALYVGHLTA